MAKGYNKVIVVGNIGADPEVKTTATGKTVLNLRVACNTSFQGADGERKEHTEWVNVSGWGGFAKLAPYLEKGQQIFVDGELRTSSYEKDGIKRYRTEINANTIVPGAKAGRSHDASDGPGPDDVPF